jgi:hypothetical protein
LVPAKTPFWPSCSLITVSYKTREKETEDSLDAEKLVVLGNTLGTGRSSGLDLTGAESDGEVGNVDGLGLTGTVRGHDTPTVGLGELDAALSVWVVVGPRKETHAWIDSEMVPIWLILRRRALQAFFSAAVRIRAGLVTKRSSPTIWTVEALLRC